jgi:hypothetical protein
MPNTWSNTSVVLWKTLARWKNNLKFARNVDHSYSDEFGKTVGSHNKAGQTINVPKPQRFTVTAAQAANFQNIVNLTTPLTMSIQANVAYQISSAERFLNADRIYEKYGKPAADALSNYVDFSAFSYAVQVCPNFVGTPGTAPTDNGIFLDAGVQMDNFDAPMNVEDRMLIVSPQQMRKAVTNDQTLFHAGQEIAKQYRTGTVGEAHGFQWFKSQNTPTGTTATFAGTPTVSGASQTGTTLITTGWTSGSLAAGDKFTIGGPPPAAGVYTVNAQSRANIGVLQQFTVTATTALTSGPINVPIYPAINPTGQYQNVSNSPAAGAAINMWSATAKQYVAGLAFHEKAFAVVYGKLDTPDKGVIEAYSDNDPETGCNMRYMMYLDGDNDQWKVRWDILFGFGGLYPEWASVILGSPSAG